MILKIIAYVLRKLMISPLEFFNTISENIALFPEEREKFFLLSFTIFEVLINAFLFSYIELKAFSIFTLVKVFFCNVIGLVILGFFFLYSNKDRYKINQVYITKDINDCNNTLDVEGETMYTCKYSIDRDNELTGESILSEMNLGDDKNTENESEFDTILTKANNIDNKDKDSVPCNKVSKNLEVKDIVEDSIVESVINELGLDKNDPVSQLDEDNSKFFDDIEDLKVPDIDIKLNEDEMDSVISSSMIEFKESSIEDEIDLISKSKTLDSYHNSSSQGRKRAVSRVLSKKQAEQLNKLKSTFCN